MTPTGANRGFALVTVLWLIVLLTAITASYHASARVEAKLLTAALHGAQAQAAAEAGIWIVVREHFAAGSVLARRQSRLERRVALPETTVDVTLADVSGTINLNNAQPELLASLLARASLPPAEAASIVDAILDWRDIDDVRQPYGAEDRDYAADRAPQGAKDAPFATVDELRYVHGMTEPVYRAIAPALTVHGSHNRVNVVAATEAVLRALPGTSEGAVTTTLRAQDSTAEDALRAGDSFDQRFTQQIGEDIFTVIGIATVNGTTARTTATVRYARGESRPVQVLAWQSNTPSIDAANDHGATHAP